MENHVINYFLALGVAGAIGLIVTITHGIRSCRKNKWFCDDNAFIRAIMAGLAASVFSFFIILAAVYKLDVTAAIVVVVASLSLPVIWMVAESRIEKAPSAMRGLLG